MGETQEDLLDILLSAASDELGNANGGNKNKVLTEIDLFGENIDDENEPLPSNPTTKNSIIHSGDTDSSDDESNRNIEARKYNECGQDIKHFLSSNLDNENKSKQRTSYWRKPPSLSSKPSIQSNSWTKSSTGTKTLPLPVEKIDVYTDPVFGIRIINPLISSTLLQERMLGREAVNFNRIGLFLQMKSKEKDWAIAGVVVNKSAVKTTKKGGQYSIWTLTDLKDDIKTVCLFLFSSAYSQLWKTSVGTVIGILNPNVLDRREGTKDEACLSIDTHQKVMIFGQSKDFGLCRSMKKNGEKCTAIVNKSRCDFCLYHIKQEYQKCSQRSELQSNFAGRGLTALRNKVLGKNEVFYAGKSYMAIPAKKSKKMDDMDKNRLKGLNGKNGGITGIQSNTKSIPKKRQAAAKLEVSQAQRIKDIELLRKLGGSIDLENKNKFSGSRSSDITLEESKNLAKSVISKLKAQKTPLEETSKSNRESKNLANSKETKITNTQMLNSADNKLGTKNKIGSFDENPSDLFNMDEEFETLTYHDNDDDSLAHSKQNTSVTSKKDITLPPPNEKCSLETPVESIKPTFIFNGSSTPSFPKLTGFEAGKMIDLNKPSTKQMDRAKLNAIRLIQKSGPIKKTDPNNTRGTGKKRTMEDILDNGSAKKSKLADSEFISDRFKKMMAMTSSHMDLLEARDEEAKEKYFNKLEVKERMEEKMTNTFKVACKAVKCLKCKYTSFSASDLCKAEKHPLRVFDAMKRFFKCGNCGNRTVSLEIVPTRPCTNCGSGKWEKTGMMKEKLVTAGHSLSIRGGEQKFTNSVVTDANINLLVPES